MFTHNPHLQYVFLYNPDMETKQKKYAQSVTGLAVIEDKGIYNRLDAEGKGMIDNLAVTLRRNLQNKIAEDPLNSIGIPKKLNMGSDSARHVIFALIRFMARQEL